MRRIIATVVASLAFVFMASPALGDTCCDGPPADVMATQDPAVASGFTSTPCATARSLNCYWDTIAYPGHGIHSYFVIRVGREACIRYWDAQYDRHHGHCVSVRHYLHRHH